MKRTTTIVLFASIFAVAVGTLGLGGISATSLMVSADPQSIDKVGMLGHVEYKIMDASGNIVQYMQGDNEVVNSGEDCVAQYVFGIGVCAEADGTPFNFIGIGNGTGIAVGPTNATLSDGTDGGPSAINLAGECAYVSPFEGELARRQVTATLLSAASGTAGTQVELDTTIPFTFDGSNATTVRDSGLFNSDFTTPGADEKCTATETSGSDWDMFSRQLLNGATGIVVTAGDSLSIKWTITIG